MIIHFLLCNKNPAENSEVRLSGFFQLCSTNPKTQQKPDRLSSPRHHDQAQWEHILDTHTSSFVLFFTICACRRVGQVCARLGSSGTIGIAEAGGSWSGSSGAIWAWWQAKLSTAGTLGKCK